MNTFNATKVANILFTHNVGQGNTSELADTVTAISSTEIRFHLLNQTLKFESQEHATACLIMLLNRVAKKDTAPFNKWCDHITSNSNAGHAYLSSNQGSESATLSLMERALQIPDLVELMLHVQDVQKIGRSRLITLIGDDLPALLIELELLGYKGDKLSPAMEGFSVVGVKVDFEESIFNALTGKGE